MTISGFNNRPATAAPTKSPTVNKPANLANNSGQGKESPVLDIISKRFNWGAFFLSWIWGLGNRSYITLLIFPVSLLGLIPFAGFFVTLGLCIWFGIKGNTWAWQNKQWKSIEHFHEVQKKWAIGGIITIILLWLINFILIYTIVFMNTNTPSQQNSATIMKSINTVVETVQFNSAYGIKCDDLSSEGIAKYFADYMKIDAKGSNSFTQGKDKTVWTFTGNGSCITQGDCSITITTKHKATAVIPVYAKPNGNLEIRYEDLDKYYN